MRESPEIFDPKLGVGNRAWAIAYLLGSLGELTDASVPEQVVDATQIQTFPMYNGRERGLAIMVGIPAWDTVGIVSFGEARNSDSTFVDSYEAPKPFNFPSPDLMSDTDYEKRRYFEYDKVSEAAAFVQNQVRHWVQTIDQAFWNCQANRSLAK